MARQPNKGPLGGIVGKDKVLGVGRCRLCDSRVTIKVNVSHWAYYYCNAPDCLDNGVTRALSTCERMVRGITVFKRGIGKKEVLARFEGGGELAAPVADLAGEYGEPSIEQMTEPQDSEPPPVSVTLAPAEQRNKFTFGFKFFGRTL